MPPTLLFDLDGTLTDPRAGIVRSIHHALERLARPCPPEAALADCIGPPLRRTFRRLLATTDPELIERAMALFRERFGVVGLFENEVYAGVDAMLAQLDREGRRMFVATAKPAVFAERIVRHFGLDRHFRGIYGPDLDGRLDDKGDLLAHLLATEGLEPGEVVMIGDREGDVAAARRHGVRAIGVLWGYGSSAELRAAGADLVCATPAELPACVARLPLRDGGVATDR